MVGFAGFSHCHSVSFTFTGHYEFSVVCDFLKAFLARKNSLRFWRQALSNHGRFLFFCVGVLFFLAGLHWLYIFFIPVSTPASSYIFSRVSVKELISDCETNSKF